jgi:hypothetical protein
VKRIYGHLGTAGTAPRVVEYRVEHNKMVLKEQLDALRNGAGGALSFGTVRGTVWKRDAAQRRKLLQRPCAPVAQVDRAAAF